MADLAARFCSRSFATSKMPESSWPPSLVAARAPTLPSASTQHRRVGRVIGQLHHLTGDGADRELGFGEQPLHEPRRTGAEDAGAVVVDDDRDAERRGGQLGLGHFAGLAVFPHREIGGREIEDRRPLGVGDRDEDGTFSRCRRARRRSTHERRQDDNCEISGHRLFSVLSSSSPCPRSSRVLALTRSADSTRCAETGRAAVLAVRPEAP